MIKFIHSSPQFKYMENSCVIILHLHICGLIDRMQKWLPINYSFIFVLISLTSLVSMRKIQKNFHTKMRLVSLISIHIKE